jgi:hypothetical protein
MGDRRPWRVKEEDEIQAKRREGAKAIQRRHRLLWKPKTYRIKAGGEGAQDDDDGVGEHSSIKGTCEEK